ncbi:MAG: META domain-containing protein, partial [Candidatus Limnocylindrales bacterium]
VAWRLDRGVRLQAGVSVTARFVGGTLSGSIAGAPYRADYVLDAHGAGLRIAADAPGAGPDATLQAYRRLLAAVDSARLDAGGGLVLLDGHGDAVLWFSQADTVGPDLAGRWAVESVRRGSEMVAPVSGGNPHLWFDPAGQVMGSVGVNRVRGPARTDGDAVHLGPLVTTRMAGEPDAMDEEADLVSALERVARYRAVDDRLTLLDADAEPLVGLRRASDPPADAEAGPTRSD